MWRVVSLPVLLFYIVADLLGDSTEIRVPSYKIVGGLASVVFLWGLSCMWFAKISAGTLKYVLASDKAEANKTIAEGLDAAGTGDARAALRANGHADAKKKKAR